MSRKLFLLLSIFLLVLLTSCSSGTGNALIPSSNNKEVATPKDYGATACTGLWQIVADKATGKVEVASLRSADKMLNVLGFMEPPALTLMDLDWPNLVIDFVNGTIDVGVILRHPLGTNDQFTGFDVRGVCFGPDVTNADGLTIVAGPEFFTGVPFGYQNGLLGSPAATYGFTGLAGYKYYCDNLGATDDLATFFSITSNIADRGKFSGTAPHQRDYHLAWSGTGYDFLIFNYAIYANYDWPIGDPPYTLDEFSITTANSAEAFCARFTETANSLWYSGGSGGGSISLDVEIWDWQENISDVTMESVEAGVIPQTPSTAINPGPIQIPSEIYTFTDVAADPTSTGDLDLFVTATDPVTFGEAWFLNLLSTSHPLFSTPVYNCFPYTATVAECPPPVITSLVPPNGWTDESTNVVVNCTFIAGPSLAVTLRSTSQPDIFGVITGSDPVAGTINVTFDLTGAVPGKRDVIVTNGCGTDGQLVDGFEVLGCSSTSIPASYTWFGGGVGPMAYMGVGVTKQGNNMVFGQHHYIGPFEKLAAVDASGPWSAPIEGYCCPIGTHSLQSNKGFACDSQNNTYYIISLTSSPYTSYVYTMPWNSSTNSWGSYSALPSFPSGTVQRICVDNNDVLHAYTTGPSRVYTYNSSTSSWSFITPAVPTSGGESICDFDYNPASDDYVFILLRWSAQKVDFYAFDATTAAQTFADTDLFSWLGSTYWRAGIYVDQSSPGCRILIWGGGDTSIAYNIPLLRYNGKYGQKTTGALNIGYTPPSYNCNNADYSPELDRLIIPQQTFSTIYFGWPSDW